MFVKVCGITNRDDALFALAMGADAIGMVLAPSKRRVHPDTVRDVVQALPSDAVVVGVFRDERPETILEVVEHARLRGVQLHGHEIPRDASLIRRKVPFLVQAFVPGDPRLERLDEYPIDAVMLDSSVPGSGVAFDWNLAEGVAPGKRVILAGGLTPDTVADAVEQVRPWGVDVSSGVEAEPGRKDPRKVRRFVAAASEALSEFSADTGQA
ncbi:MAG TPA: phosphoribosylanthranilate isomerase [Acidimicrobiales bacterium]